MVLCPREGGEFQSGPDMKPAVLCPRGEVQSGPDTKPRFCVRGGVGSSEWSGNKAAVLCPQGKGGASEWSRHKTAVLCP